MSRSSVVDAARTLGVEHAATSSSPSEIHGNSVTICRVTQILRRASPTDRRGKLRSYLRCVSR
jgi:hypothetical protein